MWYLQAGLFIGILFSIIQFIAPIFKSARETMIEILEDSIYGEQVLDPLDDIISGNEEGSFGEVISLVIGHFFFSSLLSIVWMIVGCLVGIPLLVFGVLAVPVWFVIKRNRKKNINL